MESPSISDEAVTEATGKKWDAWFALLHDMGAAEMPHQEIARRLVEEHDVAPWWAQTVTVEFERAIGRREPGQSSSGDFATSASKTLRGDMDSLLEEWRQVLRDRRSFDGVGFDGDADVRKTDNWRYWRVSLQDGSRVVVNFSDKGSGKALLQVNHEKLPDKEAVERWKAYWKGFLEDMSAKQVPR